MSMTRTVPTISVAPRSRPATAREVAVRASVKASKAHRDRLPAMTYADRVTTMTRTWDMTSTRREDALARRAAAIGVTGRTIAQM